MGGHFRTNFGGEKGKNVHLWPITPSHFRLRPPYTHTHTHTHTPCAYSYAPVNVTPQGGNPGASDGKYFPWVGISDGVFFPHPGRSLTI